jgi:hypothetical protein
MVQTACARTGYWHSTDSVMRTPTCRRVHDTSGRVGTTGSYSTAGSHLVEYSGRKITESLGNVTVKGKKRWKE